MTGLLLFKQFLLQALHFYPVLLQLQVYDLVLLRLLLYLDEVLVFLLANLGVTVLQVTIGLLPGLQLENLLFPVLEFLPESTTLPLGFGVLVDMLLEVGAADLHLLVVTVQFQVAFVEVFNHTLIGLQLKLVLLQILVLFEHFFVVKSPLLTFPPHLLVFLLRGLLLLLDGEKVDLD